MPNLRLYVSGRFPSANTSTKRLIDSRMNQLNLKSLATEYARWVSHRQHTHKAFKSDMDVWLKLEQHMDVRRATETVRKVSFREQSQSL